MPQTRRRWWLGLRRGEDSLQPQGFPRARVHAAGEMESLLNIEGVCFFVFFYFSFKTLNFSSYAPGKVLQKKIYKTADEQVFTLELSGRS